MTEDAQKPVEGAPGPAPVGPDPVIVPASGTGPAPGADIVGTSLQPNPGEQPGEVADTPVVARSAADPNPEDHQEPLPASKEDANQVGTGSANDPLPEIDAQGATDPAVHNPRHPLDAPAPDAVNEAQAEFAPQPEGGDPAVNRNALRGVPTGPEHTRHGQHTADRKLAPPRRGDFDDGDL